MNFRQLLIFLVSFYSQFIFSQKENNNWMIQENLGISFNTDPVTILSESAIGISVEGKTTVSNSNGELLFYSDGEKVWNRQHEVCSTCDNLNGNRSTAQGVYVITVPNFESLYYIITLDHNASQGNLWYSTFDLNQNSGLGSIVSKNVFIGTRYTERMAVIRGYCGVVWIVVHHRDNAEFHSYKIHSVGINLQPAISNVGMSYAAGNGNGPDINWARQIKASKNQNLLASVAINGWIELFHFNRDSGKLTLKSSFPMDTINTEYFFPYSVCFSPNSELLYVGAQDFTS